MDMSNLTDAQLVALANGKTPDMSGLTDAQLEALANSGGSATPASPARTLTVTPPAKSSPSWLDVGKDVAASGVTGVGRGAIGIMGAPADAAHYAGVGMQWLMNKARGAAGYAPLDTMKDDPLDPQQYAGSAAITKGIEGDGPGMYKPETTAGKYAETVGSFIPGSGVRSFGQLAARAVLPGVASETAGQLTEGSAAEPYARMAGALAGGGLASAGRKAITPMTIAPERAALVQSLRDEGVTDLTAGQVTGSKRLQAIEGALSEVPGGSGRLDDLLSGQKTQFTRAALSRAGISADAATPDVLQSARDRIGGTFDDLSSRNTLQMDHQMGQDMGDVLARYGRVLEPNQKAIVENLVHDVADHGSKTGWTMDGQMYQMNRSDLTQMAKGASNPNFGNAIRGIRDALDSAMQRSISPEDAEAWNTANRQYGALKTISKAGAGAGEATAAGALSPSLLRNAATTGRREGYAMGQGPFDSLARAGSGVMTTFPNSGTAARSNVMALLRGAGTAVGAAAGAGVGGISGAALAAPAAAVVAPALASRALMSGPVQRYLKNQALPAGAPISASERLRALLAKVNGAGASTNR